MFQALLRVVGLAGVVVGLLAALGGGVGLARQVRPWLLPEAGETMLAGLGLVLLGLLVLAAARRSSGR